MMTQNFCNKAAVHYLALKQLQSLNCDKLINKKKYSVAFNANISKEQHSSHQRIHNVLTNAQYILLVQKVSLAKPSWIENGWMGKDPQNNY